MVGVLAGSATSSLKAIDDPPPEPVTCPLCGGDPAVHVQKTFAMLTTAANAATDVMHW